MLTMPCCRIRVAVHRLLLLFTVVAARGSLGSTAADDISLVFDPATFTVKSATVEGQEIVFRAYEGIVYVARPVDPAYQSMNIYVPAAYFEGKTVGGYDEKTAPIFLPNAVGGYMPARPGGLGQGQGGGNASLIALSKGYVVAAPGARGRTLRNANGTFTGKAPAAIVDLKAAVRYLRFNDHRMPGDARKIVSNGTSAGGALSALLGASGNHPDFEPYLKALGAAVATDDIFAVSAYCPITNLEHADMAYEWQFSGVNEFSRGRGRPEAGGAGAPGRAGGPGGQAAGTMTDEQIRLSALLKAEFPAYVNGLGLERPDGAALTLDANGDGAFRDYVKSYVMASAQKVLAGGQDLSALPWLTIANGKVTDVDFNRYVRFTTRMKVTPAFDSPELASPENDLFGNETTAARHFTRFGQEHSATRAPLAEPGPIRQMNAMSYIGAPGATTSTHWRIRHGSVDRDTSLAIPVILATKLANSGKAVDFAVPWGVGHGGNYDLDELFAWMASVSSSQPRAQSPDYDATRESDIEHLKDTKRLPARRRISSASNRWWPSPTP